MEVMCSMHVARRLCHFHIFQYSAHPVLSSTSNPPTITGLVPIWTGFGSRKGATVYSSCTIARLIAIVVHCPNHSSRHRLTGSGEGVGGEWVEQTVWTAGSHHCKLLQVGWCTCCIHAVRWCYRLTHTHTHTTL